MTELSFRHRRLVRGSLLLLLAGGAAVGVYVLAVVPPTAESWYPGCTFHRTTGLHCPGCGTTRCLHALLNGHVEQAVAYNPIALILVPVVGLAMGTSLWHWAWGTRPRFREPSKWWPIGLTAFLLLFWIVRNIPAYPFTWLAPHTI